MSRGHDKLQSAQDGEILPYLPLGGFGFKLRNYLPQRQTATGLVEKGQNRLLPFGQISPYALGRHITAGAKAHGHATTCILDLRLGQTGRCSQLARFTKRTGDVPMTDSRFLLQTHVDAVYEAAARKLAFRARTPAEFHAWQAALRGKTLELLGLAGRTPPEAVAAEKLQAVERDGYVEEKYLLDAGEDVSIPAYLLVPKTKPPYRPVLVFHGHNPSVQWILGNYPSAEERESRLKVDNNYAQALAQAGYLVCAVEQRGFGERQTEDGRGSVHENSCRHLAFAYQMAGRNLVGERCWDGMCAIAFLKSRPDVAPGVLGCTGNSGGGTTALWLSAVDERITVSAPGC